MESERLLIKSFEDFNLPYEERWENLTLGNDFLFGKIFQDKQLCLELIQIILPELKIKSISFPRLQKNLKHTFDTRGVRFDVYLHDNEDRIINIEMQPVNRDNIRKRTRAYHSIIDLEAFNTDKVKKYDDMPEVIVIFICGFDLFNSGRHIYTFKQICVQDKEIILNDGAMTIFLNAKGKLNDVSPQLTAFLNFVMGKTSDDEFVKKLELKLFEAKQNFLWRQEYMLYKFERQSEIYDAEERGRTEERFDIARRMRKSGLSDVDIRNFTNLSINEIQNL